MWKMLKFPLPELPDLSLPISSLNQNIFDQLCCLLDQKNLCMKLFTHTMKQMNQPNLHSRNASLNANQLFSLFARWNCNAQVLALLLEQCNMYEPLYLLKERIPVQINKQPPARVVVKHHKSVELTCVVTDGFPKPTFQWFFNNSQIDDATQQTLFISDFRSSNAGTYRCEVSQLCRDGTLEKLSSIDSELVLERFPPIVVKEPSCCQLKTGDFAELRFKVEGNPSPTLQWYKDDILLLHKTSTILQIVCASSQDAGKYKCLATNSEGNICSKEASVEVVSFQSDNNFTLLSWQRNIHLQYSDSNHSIKGAAVNLSDPPTSANARNQSSLERINNLSITENISVTHTATMKQALLIGNWTYKAHKLEKVRADVKTLHDILYEHKFDAISLCNLNKMDILNAADRFCQLLLPGAYVVVYFAGHGIHYFNDYLMPVDLVIDSDYSVKDLVDVNEIIAKIQKTCPKMLMVLLDMCRTIPTEEKNPRIRSEMPKEVPRDSRTNLVMAWATSENSSAYEMNHEANGIFMTYLKREMEGYKLSVIEMLERLKQHSKREIPYEARHQMPVTFSSLAEPLSLHDPIDSSLIGEVPWITSQMMADTWKILPQNYQIAVQVEDNPVVIRVNFSMMDECFSNGLRVELMTDGVDEQVLNFHSPSIYPATLEWLESHGRNSGNYVITIHKLQSLTEDAILVLKLPESDSGTVQINIGQPLIAKARLAMNHF